MTHGTIVQSVGGDGRTVYYYYYYYYHHHHHHVPEGLGVFPVP